MPEPIASCFMIPGLFGIVGVVRVASKLPGSPLLFLFRMVTTRLFWAAVFTLG